MDNFIALALEIASEVPGGARLDDNGDCVQVAGTDFRFVSRPKGREVAHITVADGEAPDILSRHGITPARPIKQNKGGTTEVVYAYVSDCTRAFLKDCFLSRLKAIKNSKRRKS